MSIGKVLNLNAKPNLEIIGMYRVYGGPSLYSPIKDFGKEVMVYHITMSVAVQPITTPLILQGSNDGFNYINIYTLTPKGARVITLANVELEAKYRYFRLYFPTKDSSSDNSGQCTLIYK